MLVAISSDVLLASLMEVKLAAKSSPPPSTSACLCECSVDCTNALVKLSKGSSSDNKLASTSVSPPRQMFNGTKYARRVDANAPWTVQMHRSNLARGAQVKKNGQYIG